MIKTVFAIAFKDLRLLMRDHAGIFWVIGFPLLMATFFGSIFGSGERGARAMPVAVVDEDATPVSQAFIQRLEKSEALAVQRLPRADAQESVRRGKLVAYVVLKKGFGESSGFFGNQALPLEVGIDPSRRAESGYLQGILTEAAFRAMQEQDPANMRPKVQESLKEIESAEGIPPDQRKILTRFMGELDQFLGTVDPAGYKKGLQTDGARIEVVPVTTQREGPRSAFEISFPQAILWGLIGCVAAFAISIVNERAYGTFLRLRIAPISRGQILAGKGSACFLACVIEIGLLLATGHFIFGVRLQNAVSLALAIASTSAGFVGIMMLLSVLGKTEQAVAGAGWGILIVMAMFGGGMVPLMMMPGWMQRISHLSPVKWGILALEGAIWRGFTLGEMFIPCAILLAVGVICFGAGVTILSRSEA